VKELDRKAKIVAECWMLTRDVDAWEEILKYGDLGFPLAYAYNSKLVNLNKEGVMPILEIYSIICESLEIDPDKRYEDFEAMLDQRIKDQGIELPEHDDDEEDDSTN